jgi:hypothetical protein
MVMPMPPMPGMEMPPPPGADVPDVPPLQFLAPEMLQPYEGEYLGYPQQPLRVPPTMDEIVQRANRAQDRWRERDIRMDEDYELYTMTAARRKDKAEGEKVVRNLIYALVEKAANMIGAQTPVIKHEPTRLENREPAQRIENLLRHAWDQWNYRWMQGLHTPLSRDMAHFIILRGWLTARVSLSMNNDPDEVPVNLTLADPRYVYPSLGSNGNIRYVVYKYPSTVGEVLDEWPEAEGLFHDAQDDQTCEVTAYYDDWWHAVLVDGHEVKPPTEHAYGFVPWVFAMGNGAPVRAAQGHAPDPTSETGVSLFHSIKYAYKQQNRVLSQLADEVARAANPPTIYYYDQQTEEPEKLDLNAGATNYLLQTERAQFLETTPNPNNVSPLLNALEEDVTKGGLPDVLWGGAPGDQSGFAIALLSGAARDQLFGVISALEFSYEQINRYALTLIRDHIIDPVGVIVRDKHGNYKGAEVVYPEEIAEVGIRNRVKFRDIAPQDKFQQIQAAIALTDKNLISMELARDEYIGVDDPEEENQKVLAEMIYRDEDILREIFNPYALYKHSPEMFEIWLAMQRFKRFEKRQAELEAMQMQQQAPPGVPPMPGVPPDMTPAPMGPEMFDPTGQAQASAMGGAGMERTPGIPGIGGIIPGGLGV